MTLGGIMRIREIVPLKSLFSKILSNTNIGSNLMFSNVASMLVLEMVRCFVQQKMANRNIWQTIIYIEDF